MNGKVKENWIFFNALLLLRKMLCATSPNRLHWGPSLGWCPNDLDKPLMQFLHDHGLVYHNDALPGSTAPIYYFATDEAHELFGMEPPAKKGTQ